MNRSSSPAPLTRRQKEILDFFGDFLVSEGIPPTHREIRDHFGYTSYGTVHKHLRLLREKGYLSREANQKRGMRLLEVAEPRQAPSRSALAELPFLGRIAAGAPIEAIESDESLAVPSHLLGTRGEHYVLQVVGDSMIEEGIHDGDLVIVERRDQAEVAQMVVALVDGEATVKRFYPEGDQVRLQPANHRMEPIYIDAASLRIQGIVVGLMRRF